MNDRRHRIHRQLFELTAATGEPAWAWDHTSADFHRDLLLPVLEACFREADSGGAHLVIDRLEVDLGVFDGKEAFARDAAGRLRERLVQGLREKRREASARGIASPGEPSATSVPAQRDNATADAGRADGIAPPELLDRKAASIAAFLFFLQTGRLPWWFNGGGENAFGESFQEALTVSDIRKILFLLDDDGSASPLSHCAPAAIRCIQSMGDAALARLALEKGGKAEVWLRGWDLLKSPAQRFPAFFPAFRQRYWSWLLTALPDAPGAPWHSIFPGRETPAQLPALVYSEMLQAGHDLPGLRHFLEARPATPAYPPEPDAPKERGSKEAEGSAPPQRAHPSTETKNNITDIPEEDGWYVESAGLVLLHPFLPELFAATGCRSGKEWLEGGQQTAVRLLGYLSDGDAGLPEYRLVFQKVLAGLAPEAPLEAVAPITENQLASCDELLGAVLRHWAALKNTTADGLREGFLQRPGMLRSGPAGLQLEMEKRAQDVLIGRLPWSCSLVRLSWMERMVAVNWI